MRARCGRPGAGTAKALLWLAITRELQIIHVRLRPFQTRLLTKDAESKIVFATDGHLACPQYPLGAIPETHENVNVIIDAPAGNKSMHVCGDRFASQTGSEADEVVSVAADITERPSQP